MMDFAVVGKNSDDVIHLIYSPIYDPWIIELFFVEKFFFFKQKLFEKY